MLNSSTVLYLHIQVKTTSKRFCAVSLRLPDLNSNSYHNVLLTNVYLPTDYGTSDSNNAFLEALCELEGFIAAQSFDNLVISGDFNVDFSRNTHNCNLLLSFMHKHNLVCADTSSSIQYTYVRDDNASHSFPDHILVSCQYVDLINEVTCLDDVANLSDHLPLSFSLVLKYSLSQLFDGVPTSTNDSPNSGVNSSNKVDWNKVTSNHITAFCNYVHQHLPIISDEILTCCDPKCSSHSKTLDSLCNQVLQCILDGSQLHLPKHKSNNRSIPGWNSHVRPLYQTAAFWHKVWCDCGHPTSGVLFQIKKNTKKRFKYEVRRLRRQAEHVKREMLGIALSRNRQSDFWKTVRRIAKSSKGTMSSVPIVDGYSSDLDISNTFSAKIKNLLNSNTSLDSCSSLLSNIESSLSSSDLASISVSTSTIAEAISHLKPNKSDGSLLSSNHFIHASSTLIDVLSQLFTSILRHGYIPECLRDCVLHPIPKPGKDPSVSDNYRPIALAPTLSKVFEWCGLIEYRSAFVTSPLQFGFKQGFSTDLCTGLIKNVVARYNINNTDVYGCFLDASKAFDRVDHQVLFQKLIQRKLPPVVVRALLTWYSDQMVSVSWNGCQSSKFGVTNGVRQGGVLSPILFTVYLDDLLKKLEENGVGCFWSHYFVGAVCYADDIALLAPSPSALRQMLSTCSSFAISHSLLFNVDKTQLIRFSRYPMASTCTPVLSFNNLKLKLNRSVTHLGHILTQDLSDNEDITSCQKDLCRKANCMLHTFSCCDPFTKTELFRTFCLSLYGCALWLSSATQIHSLEVTFNNIIRKIWSLPRNCHTSILHLVAGLHSLRNTVIFRSLGLVSAAFKSQSPLLADVYSQSIKLVYTSVGYNYQCDIEYT